MIMMNVGMHDDGYEKRCMWWCWNLQSPKDNMIGSPRFLPIRLPVELLAKYRSEPAKPSTKKAGSSARSCCLRYGTGLIGRVFFFLLLFFVPVSQLIKEIATDLIKLSRETNNRVGSASRSGNLVKERQTMPVSVFHSDTDTWRKRWGPECGGALPRRNAELDQHVPRRCGWWRGMFFVT